MSSDTMWEAVGWAAAVVLLATIVQQVWKQWKSGDTRGVSKWLFVGQSFASVGFTLYSWHTRNWVFVTVNAALLVSAIVGELIYWRNRRRQAGRKAQEPSESNTARRKEAPGRA
jgi:uncharacterized protein with PQ loop repeat